MNRRLFLGALGAAAVDVRRGVWAQQPGPRVGWLTSSVIHEPNVRAFQDGMRALGYGAVTIEYRAASGETHQLPDLAADLVRSKVDIVVVDGGPAAAAARRVISDVPVVIGAMGDPVAEGIVASLSRPGGNITGFSISTGQELNGKRLDLIRDAVPGLTRVGIVWNDTNRTARGGMEHATRAARALGLEVAALAARDADRLGQVFADAARSRLGAVVVIPDAFFWSQRRHIVGLARRHRVPAIYPEPEFAAAGGLLAYGPNVPDNFRRAAGYVDRILKGAKPADLPVEQPTTFELVINLETARTLGLSIPRSLLVRADRIIE